MTLISTSTKERQEDRPPRLSVLPPAARERWDAFVTEAGGHVFQSWGWGELKARTGWTPWRVAWEEAGRICAGVSILARPENAVVRTPGAGARSRASVPPHGLSGGCLSTRRDATSLTLEAGSSCRGDAGLDHASARRMRLSRGAACRDGLRRRSAQARLPDQPGAAGRRALAAAPREDATRPPSLGATRHARPGGRVARRGSNVLPSSS